MTKRLLLTLLVLGGFCAVQTFAGTYLVGMENSVPSSGTIEGIGDYNDFVMSLSSSDLTLVDLGGGAWSPTSGVTLWSPQSLNSGAGSSVTDPFWNNGSLDGTSDNIGYCAENIPNCNGGVSGTIPATNEFLSVGGASDTDFYFSTPSGAGVSTVALALIADGNSSVEYVNWYDPLDNSKFGTVYAAGTSAGATFTLTLPAGVTTFGLVFGLTSTPSNYYVTNNGLSAGASDSGDSRFAVFTSSSVPEPGTLALFGIGALAFGLIPRLRKRR
jgi:hypothetical protein